MAYSEQIFNKAMAEVSQRRADAKLRHEERYNQIGKLFPDILQLRSKLAFTSAELSRLVLQNPDNLDRAIADIMRKNLETRSKIEQILIDNGYEKDYLSFHHHCGLCEDTGYYKDGLCNCVKKIMCELNCEDIIKNSSLSLCCFSSFDLDFYPDTPDKDGIIPRMIMTEALDFCCDYAEGFSLQSPSLLFTGHTGLGKTHLSLAIANVVMSKGFSMAYITANELVSKTQEEYFGRDKSNNTLETLTGADLVVLDDLGAEFDTKFSLSVIHELVNSRLNRGLPTIINTNLNSGEMLEAYNDRVVSRILGCYQAVKFLGKDIRQLKSRKN